MVAVFLSTYVPTVERHSVQVLAHLAVGGFLVVGIIITAFIKADCRRLTADAVNTAKMNNQETSLNEAKNDSLVITPSGTRVFLIFLIC